MIYSIKKKSVFELIVALGLTSILPFSIAILFLFKSSKKVSQRVAIPPQRLNWAKLWMSLSGGLWWFYLRYFAAQCPNCHCVWYKELVDSTVLDVQQEQYTYKDTLTTKHYAGPSGSSGSPVIGTSETKVDKAGIKTITTAENTYRCINCNYVHSLVESSQDIASTLNQFKR